MPPNRNIDEIAYFQECDKLHAYSDSQIDAIRSEREKDRDELLIHRDQVFICPLKYSSTIAYCLCMFRYFLSSFRTSSHQIISSLKQLEG